MLHIIIAFICIGQEPLIKVPKTSETTVDILQAIHLPHINFIQYQVVVISEPETDKQTAKKILHL